MPVVFTDEIWAKIRIYEPDTMLSEQEQKHYYRTLRHFPDLKLSVPQVSCVNAENLRPCSSGGFRATNKCNNTNPTLSHSIHTRHRKVKLTPSQIEHVYGKSSEKYVAVQRLNKISHQMDRLKGSEFDKIEDHYHDLRKNIIVARMERNRKQLEKQQPYLQSREGVSKRPTSRPASSGAYQPGRSAPQSTGTRRPASALSRDADVGAIAGHSAGRTSSPSSPQQHLSAEELLDMVKVKLARVGFTVLDDEPAASPAAPIDRKGKSSSSSNRQDMRSGGSAQALRTSGLLAVLGVSQHSTLSERDLSAKLEAMLGIRLSLEELCALHSVLFRGKTHAYH